MRENALMTNRADKLSSSRTNHRGDRRPPPRPSARPAAGGSGRATGSVRAGMTAVAALSADLLPDWYDDWMLVEAEDWRQLRLHALEALAGHLTAAGRWARRLALPVPPCAPSRLERAAMPL
jgi:hypothetical protein